MQNWLILAICGLIAQLQSAEQKQPWVFNIMYCSHFSSLLDSITILSLPDDLQSRHWSGCWAISYFTSHLILLALFRLLHLRAKWGLPGQSQSKYVLKQGIKRTYFTVVKPSYSSRNIGHWRIASQGSKARHYYWIIWIYDPTEKSSLLVEKEYHSLNVVLWENM